MSQTIAAITVQISEVEPERVSWLWKGRIPLGKITVFDGDPDNGKSTVSLDLAARLSRNAPMPDGMYTDIGQAAGTVLLTAEDGMGDTIRPRLDAAGGDSTMITAITGTVTDDGYEHPFDLPDDIAWLRDVIESTGSRLVVIDPLMAFLNAGTNSFRDQDIRRALAPLARMAEETEAAVVIIRHLNKMQGGSAIYRGGGSIGIIGAARSGLLAAKDPDDESRRILAVTKANLAAPVPALAYRLEPTADDCVRIAWEGSTFHNAGQLLAGPRDDEERTARDDAKDALRDILSDGPIPVEDAKRMLQKSGISEATWRRAKTDLGVVAKRVGNLRGGGYYAWELPDIGCSASHEQPIREQPIKAYPHGQNGSSKGLVAHSHGNEQPIKDQTVCRDCGAHLSSNNTSGFCGRCISQAVKDGRLPLTERR